MARLTRDALIAQNSALSAECAELRAELSKLRAYPPKPEQSVEDRFPLIDKLGRRYRQESYNVRAYPAS